MLEQERTALRERLGVTTELEQGVAVRTTHTDLARDAVVDRCHLTDVLASQDVASGKIVNIEETMEEHEKTQRTSSTTRPMHGTRMSVD